MLKRSKSLTVVVGALAWFWATSALAEERLWVEAKINSHRAWLALDTGASHSVLFDEFGERLGLTRIDPPDDLSLPAGQHPLGWWEECELELEGQTFRTRFRTLNVPAYLRSTTDGILWWNAVRENILWINARAGLFIPLKRLPDKALRWTKLQVNTNWAILAVDVPLNGETNVMFIDTGAQGGVALPPREWTEWRTANPAQPITLGAGWMPGFGPEVRHRAWADFFQVGPLDLRTVLIEEMYSAQSNLASGQSEVVLELAALGQLELIIDGGEGVVYLKPKKASSRVYRHNRLGAAFIPRDDQTDDLVAHVVKNSPAQEVGIEPGDILLRIDDDDVGGWRTNRSTPFSRRWSLPAGTQLQLELRRGTNTFETTVTLRDMIGPNVGRGAVSPEATLNRVRYNAFEASLRLGSDELNAALLGRQCAVIWFTSESKVFKEEAMSSDIRFAAILASALGISYSEKQFRNAFRKSGHHVAGDFDSLFPGALEKRKGDRIRDLYLFSFWCTASRQWARLVPLWHELTEIETATKWVAALLAKAEKVAEAYDPEVAARCHALGIRSLSEPLGTFDVADEFASEVLDVQKGFLSKFMTDDEVAQATQPLLMRNPGLSNKPSGAVKKERRGQTVVLALIGRLPLPCSCFTQWCSLLAALFRVPIPRSDGCLC